MTARTLARLGAPTLALAVAVGLPIALAGPAAAHVTITPTGGTAAGSYTVLTAAFGHGCEGSPTTGITISVPEQVNAITPTRVAGWEAEKVMETLDEPITDSHGNEVTERVAQVVYTADEPLADGYRAAFDLSLQLPDAPGETLAFPTIQTCEQGETAWTEIAAEGAEEPEHPAPAVTITEAVEGDGHGAAADTASHEEDTEATVSTDAEGDDSDGGSDGTALGVAGLVAGLLGLATGVAALVVARRKA
jgi:periplasmic copper chaperone A